MVKQVDENAFEKRGSWSRAERYIAIRLDDLDKKIDQQGVKIDSQGSKIYEMHGEVSGLKVRASAFGILGGFLAALLSFFGMKHG